MAEDSLTWRDGVSAAVLQKQIFGRFAETCCRPDNMGSLQWATGETAETRLDDSWGRDAGITDKERLLLDDIGCKVDEASGDDRGGFGGKRWFFVDGLLSVIVPNLCLRLLPLIQPGMHVRCPDHLRRRNRSQQARPLSFRSGTRALLERLESQHNADCESTASQPPCLPSTTLVFRVCTDFKFRQEKRNDFFKCHDIFIDSVFVEKGFASLRARPFSEAISARAPHNSELQVSLTPPQLLLAAICCSHSQLLGDTYDNIHYWVYKGLA